MKVGRRAALLLLLSGVAASCSRCAGGKSASSAEELLPAQPAGAVVTAPLAALGQHFAALLDRAAALPVGEQLGDARRQLAAQLGFDPLSRDGQLSAGLDPDRGAALALTAPPSWIAALPLSKPELFLATFDRLARERAGYALRTDEARGDLRIAVYARDAQARQKLAAAVVRGYGVVARGPDPAAEIAAAAIRKDGLAQEPRLRNTRERLGAQDLIVFAPAGSELPRRFIARPLPGDVGLGLSGTAQGVAARLFAQLPAPQPEQLAAALPGGGASLVALLPAGAPLKVRLGLSPAELLQQLDQVASLHALRARLDGADAALMAALQPGAALSLGAAKGINIPAAMDYGLDFSRKSPFDTLQLVALARTADRPRALQALERIARQLPALGARVERTGDDFRVTYGPGLQGVRFGLRADGLAYLLGGDDVAPGDLRAAEKPASASALWADPGAALELDLGQLASTVQKLPDSAYGSGPQAYVARSLVSQVIEPLRPLRVTATALPGKDGLSAGLSLEIVAP